MNRKPLPHPPQMRNGGLPPAHLPTSPHSNPVAAILSDLKAIVSNVIAASAEKAACRQKLLDEQAAHACQEAADTRACVSDAIARAHQDAAREKALADKANKQHRHEAAAREKALADEANEIRQAAMREKALADEADKLRQAAAREEALADKANEQCRATMRKKALANKVNKRCCRPSTTVDGQPQTACRRSQPCLRVGCRQGPRAPNPQEHLLHGRQHRPRTPNQSTVNGWA